jgi:polysaccharide export outer membrane protein
MPATPRLRAARPARAAWLASLGRVVALAIAMCAISPGVSAQPIDYVIGPQDVLSITVFDQKDLDGRYTVETDGTFTFPLVGRVSAGGTTVRQFEAALRAKLANGYFKNPQILVKIEEYRSQRVFVMGEVRTPGTVALTGGMTLIEALARAGSTLPSASGEVAVVRPRHGVKGPISPDEDDNAEVIRISLRRLESGSRSQNLELKDGDTIFVPRAETIFVFGQVKNPNVYSVQKDTTVLQALSLAGGATENAALNRIKIVRMVNGQKSDITGVKLSDVVQPGDTIMVPERFF